MKQATIAYEDDSVFRALAAMGRELGFTVIPPEEGVEYINGIPVRKGKGLTMGDIEELGDIFTEENMDLENLRKSRRDRAW